MDMEHISSMSSCVNLGAIKPGEQWAVQADYNLTAHAPMVEADGTPAPVMGIALFYVAEGYNS